MKMSPQAEHARTRAVFYNSPYNIFFVLNDYWHTDTVDAVEGLAGGALADYNHRHVGVALSVGEKSA